MLYEDILNALKIKESHRSNERIKNKNFKKITVLIEQLLKTIYAEEKIILIGSDIKSLETIRTTKNVLIKKIKEEIQNINTTHHLHIDNIIQSEKINTKELEFALNMIYKEPNTQKELEKSRKYAESQTDISYINGYLDTIKEDNQEIMTQLKNIKEIDNEGNKPKKIHIISYIKWKMQNVKAQKQIEQMKTIIIKKLEDTIRHAHDDVRDRCIKDIYIIKGMITELEKTKINNETRHNIKFKIKKTYEEMEQKIKKLTREKKEKQEILRTNIKLSQEQLNEVIYINNRTYATTMALQSFQNDKNKMDELVVRVILMIKLISMIENNEINIQNIIEEKAKTK